MNAKLVVVQGRPLGREIELPVGRFVIGRGKDCQLRPNSELISRYHCCIEVDETGVRVREMGSTNGTFVNGKQISAETEMNSGDLLTVGPLTFALAITDVAPAQAPSPAKEAAAPTIGAEDFASDDELAEWLAEGQEATAARPGGIYGGATLILGKNKVAHDLTMAENGEDDEKTAQKRAEQETRVLPPNQKRTTADAASDLMRRYFQRPQH